MSDEYDREYLSDKDYTNYVMGAAHVTPGVGGHYTLLMDALENHADIPSAMKEYIPATICIGEMWSEILLRIWH